METRDDMQSRAKVWDMVKDIRIALMVTQDGSGMLHARPMSAVKREGEHLWFMTRGDSHKITEIKQHSHVLLSYSEPKDQNYVSINGNAEIVNDRAKIKELWSEFLRTWFPKGPDDPAIALIRVDAEAAEYWDSPSSAFVYAYGYVKARLTGKIPEELGDVAHVNL
jgi:general stress protein 26